jgi:hypothetical protein
MPVHRSVRPSIYVPAHLFLHPSVCLPICLPVSPSIHWSLIHLKLRSFRQNSKFLFPCQKYNSIKFQNDQSHEKSFFEAKKEFQRFFSIRALIVLLIGDEENFFCQIVFLFGATSISLFDDLNSQKKHIWVNANLLKGQGLPI